MKPEEARNLQPGTLPVPGSCEWPARRIIIVGLFAGLVGGLVASRHAADGVSAPDSRSGPAVRVLDAGEDAPRSSGARDAERRDETGAEAEHDYLRFVPGEEPGEGELQTSIVTMVGDGGVEVDLIAVVHVADAGYYRKLEKRFETYDSLLYEMVKEDGVKPVPGEGGDGLVSFFQRALKDLLDLQFQLDAVDYTKKNFVHADLDPDTFFLLQKERGESLLSLMLKVLRADLLARQKGGKSPQLGLVQLMLAFSSDDSARALKYLLAQQMENMEAVIAGIEENPSGEGSVIVAERNKKALEVLRRRLSAGDKKLGIFYGGAHMPDMEKRLVRDFKLRRAGEKWLSAWTIRRKQPKPADPFQRLFRPGGSKKESSSGERSPGDGERE